MDGLRRDGAHPRRNSDFAIREGPRICCASDQKSVTGRRAGPSTRFKKPEIYKIASPTAHASAGDPITQIIHGEADMLVPIASSQSLSKALTNVGVEVRFATMPKQGHMVTFLNPNTQKKMLEFFQEVLKQRPKWL